jgi:hypothetical protein
MNVYTTVKVVKVFYGNPGGGKYIYFPENPRITFTIFTVV